MSATFVSAEIASQPTCWFRAADLATEVGGVLPKHGERVAVVGCGTSWFMAMAYAALRERSGQGESDAFPASEVPRGRRYDRVVAISRSGTTTEVLDLLESFRTSGTPTVALTATEAAPIHDAADEAVLLDFADEDSVVQTRFATSTLALLRRHLGEDLGGVIQDGKCALDRPLQPYLGADQISFLGTGWTVGLAHEAALKWREAAQFWSEAYPAMDYRHGPIAVAHPGRLVWSFGEPPAGLAADVAATGATMVTSDLDPMAHLVLAQRLAVELALRRGLNPDRPRHLTRAVELPTRCEMFADKRTGPARAG